MNKMILIGLAFLISGCDVSSDSYIPTDGIDGINGKDGKDGLNGVDGENGTDGEDGVDGINGGTVTIYCVDGKDGVDGSTSLVETYFDNTYCANGGTLFTYGVDYNFNGVIDWAEELTFSNYICNGLNGENGSSGIQGEPGIQGVQGVRGKDGVNGQDGLVGIQGEPGVNGVNGLDGENGMDGVSGIDGSDGFTSLIETYPDNIHCENGGTQFTYGVDYDFNGVIDSTEVTFSNYICNGLNGKDGLTGATGLNGVDGLNGLQGIPGISGNNGVDGLPGLNGINGAQGIQGNVGPQGVQGEHGIQGVQGLPGFNGYDGAVGPRGEKGDPGSAALSGFQRHVFDIYSIPALSRSECGSYYNNDVNLCLWFDYYNSGAIRPPAVSARLLSMSGRYDSNIYDVSSHGQFGAFILNDSGFGKTGVLIKRDYFNVGALCVASVQNIFEFQNDAIKPVYVLNCCPDGFTGYPSYSSDAYFITCIEDRASDRFFVRFGGDNVFNNIGVAIPANCPLNMLLIGWDADHRAICEE
jgi:hypothetical protein